MLRFHLLGVFTLMLLFAAPTLAQQRPPFPTEEQDKVQSPSEQEIQHKLKSEQQKKRYEQMKKDSQRLLELATELKQYVDKAGENILSVEVVRKAEEMEKLAHKVKETMRGN